MIEKTQPLAWIQQSSVTGLTKTKTSHFKYHCGVIQKPNAEYSVPLYTHPKEWTGLSGEEKYKLYHSPMPLMALIEEIEYKLMSKNK
jgi:hypothetical protein